MLQVLREPYLPKIREKVPHAFSWLKSISCSEASRCAQHSGVSPFQEACPALSPCNLLLSCHPSCHSLVGKLNTSCHAAAQANSASSSRAATRLRSVLGWQGSPQGVKSGPNHTAAAPEDRKRSPDTKAEPSDRFKRDYRAWKHPQAARHWQKWALQRSVPDHVGGQKGQQKPDQDDGQGRQEPRTEAGRQLESAADISWQGTSSPAGSNLKSNPGEQRTSPAVKAMATVVDEGGSGIKAGSGWPTRGVQSSHPGTGHAQQTASAATESWISGAASQEAFIRNGVWRGWGPGDPHPDSSRESANQPPGDCNITAPPTMLGHEPDACQDDGAGDRKYGSGSTSEAACLNSWGRAARSFAGMQGRLDCAIKSVRAGASKQGSAPSVNPCRVASKRPAASRMLKPDPVAQRGGDDSKSGQRMAAWAGPGLPPKPGKASGFRSACKETAALILEYELISKENRHCL
jgi:hypothetical protein